MSSEDSHRTVVVEKDGRSEIGAFLLGAVVGAGIALLLAPGSGEETQRRLKEQAKRLKDLTEDRVRGLRDDLGLRVESAKDVVEQGKRLAADARADLEHKLERSKAAYRAGVAAGRETAREDDGPDDEDSAEPQPAG